MTISPDVDAFLDTKSTEKQPGQWRRKGTDGPPYVTDPSGDLVKSGKRKGLPKLLLYGRPSGRGKLIENTHNLQKWGERMSMWGATLAPDIVIDAGKITDEIDTYEWRRAMDTIVVRAKDAARAMIAAHRGSHVHTLTEDDDDGRSWIDRAMAGEELGISPEAQAALVQAWRRMLAVHGFEILAVEAAVVCDRWRLAGTLDRIVRLTRDMRFTTTSGEIVTLPAGTVLILDLKTGKMTLDRGVIQYWQGYAVQLAAYALGVPYDVDAETRSAWPFEVSQDWAIIAHLDVLTALEEGEARCTLVLCDLKAGIAAGDLCMEAAAWGRNNDVFSPPDANPEMVVAVPVDLPTPATDDDFARANGEPTSTSSTPSTDFPSSTIGSTASTASQDSISPTALTEASTSPSFSARRTELQARLTALPDGRKARIRAAWPADLPSLRTEHRHSDAELDRIEALMEPRQFEKDMATLGKPFDSGVGATCLPDEGPDVSDEKVAELREEFEKLDIAERLWLSIVGKQCAKAGYLVHLDNGPTTRRWSIATAMVALVKLGIGDDDTHTQTVRALLGVVLGEEVQPAVTLGTAFAALTIDEAERLAGLARAVGGPAVDIGMTSYGLLIQGPAVDAARPAA